MSRIIGLTLLGCVWAVLIASLAGCSQTKSYREREHTWARAVETDMKQLVEDIDYLLLMDRPTRLSRWHER